MGSRVIPVGLFSMPALIRNTTASKSSKLFIPPDFVSFSAIFSNYLSTLPPKHLIFSFIDSLCMSRNPSLSFLFVIQIDCLRLVITRRSSFYFLPSPESLSLHTRKKMSFSGENFTSAIIFKMRHAKTNASATDAQIKLIEGLIDAACKSAN